MPLVGEVRERVWVAGGYSGHGNALGLACGEIAARAILGDDCPELEMFDATRTIDSPVAGGPSTHHQP
jgi:glycine/D-amino acid oxidase-like deaminating enzyme